MSTTPGILLTLARQVLDLDPEPTEALMGLIAGHFATSSTLTAERLALYVSEAQAVTK